MKVVISGSQKVSLIRWALDRVVPTGDAVVCTLRAGMDQLSIDMIHRYYKRSSTIYVCYDNDETGIKKSKWLHYEFEKRGMRSVIWKYRGKRPLRGIQRRQIGS